jgi:hypothetical protein
MTQWENLPQPMPERPVGPVAASWAGFSADPRVPANQPLRASDADRDFATRLLEQARVEGRLDASEQGARALEIANSRTLGELAPLVSDLMVAHAARGYAPARGVRPAIIGWAGLALLLNGIWLMTVLTTGRLLYYWPMWPMFGTAVPLAIALLAGAGATDPARDARRDQYRSARDDHRADRYRRRAARYQQKALRRGGTLPQLPGPAAQDTPGRPPEQDLR